MIQQQIIVSGVGPLPGATMKAKRDFLMAERDHLRRLVCREPRGGRHYLAAVVTEPVTEGADFGLIYMDARRYPYLCGTATIGAVATFIQAGLIEADQAETKVLVDTPSGPMATTAYLQEGRVESIGLEFVPAFVHGQDQTLPGPGQGRRPAPARSVVAGPAAQPREPLSGRDCGRGNPKPGALMDADPR